MNTHRWLATALCAAILLAPLTAAAQDTKDPFFAELEQEGWVYVADGVFERTAKDGSLETLGFGAGGLAWELERMKGELARLQGLSAEHGDAELLDAIAALEEGIAMTEKELGQASSVPLSWFAWVTGQVSELGCALNINRSASAYPTSSGPAASAIANFSDTCPTYGCVYSYAYADGIYDGAFLAAAEIDPASGWGCGYTSASSDALTTVVATTDCHSSAIAHVRFPDGFGNWVNFTRSASNTQCRTIVIKPCILDGAQELSACGPVPGIPFN